MALEDRDLGPEKGTVAPVSETTPMSEPLIVEKIPPLENGDHLTRDEFERRYNAMSHVKKAELIEGVVYMPSPVRLGKHGRPQRRLGTWIGYYEVHTPGVIGGPNSTVRLDLDNEPQPDELLMIEAGHAGQALVDEDGYVAGAPEWVGEISASTVSLDLHAKLTVYRRNGVREYVVWRVLDKAIDWFVLRGGGYERLALTPAGIFQSEVFPGLWLDPTALVTGDMKKVLEVLYQGLESPEHAAFVERLKKP